MRYTTDKRQLINDDTTKVAVYEASYTAQEEQRRQAFQNAVAFLLASLLVVTAFGISV